MKKVALIASVASMIKQFNMNNINILIDLGCSITIISNFSEPGSISIAEAKKFMCELNHRGIKTYDIGFKRSPFSFGNLKSYNHVKRINSIENFDIIHCQSPVGGVIGRLVKKKNQKVIYTAHGFHFYKKSPKKNWIIFFPIEKLLSYKTNVLLTINSEDFNLSEKKLNAKKNIQIPGIGIDIKQFSNLEKAEKKDFGFSNSDFLLVYGAELNNNKNQIILINMMEKISKIDNKIKLLLVGQGENHDKLMEIVKNKNLEDIVYLMGYRNDLNLIISVCDIAVASSIREGLGMFVLEAMYLGLPAVVSNNRGHRTIVQPQINGFLFDLNGGVEPIIEAVFELKNDKTLYKMFSDNSKKISENFSDQCTNIIMRSVYFGLLNETE
ncbi:glycosyltransferase [Enterococcus sp. DIV0800]|uniref:glycosyltransferase n=1 Tax=unclassified Enterococcus TaxID=2608891 RepID=UPI003D2FB63C